MDVHSGVCLPTLLPNDEMSAERGTKAGHSPSVDGTSGDPYLLNHPSSVLLDNPFNPLVLADTLKGSVMLDCLLLKGLQRQ